MALKLEVGKFYRTRDGRKVGPLTHHPDRGESYRFQAVGCEMGQYAPAWFPDGRFMPRPGHQNDLIAEWTDAPTGPVRTVTRKEIVPGVYGGLRVSMAHGAVFLSMDDEAEHDASDIRHLIATLTEIADALEGNQ